MKLLQVNNQHRHAQNAGQRTRSFFEYAGNETIVGSTSPVPVSVSRNVRHSFSLTKITSTPCAQNAISVVHRQT